MGSDLLLKDGQKAKITRENFCADIVPDCLKRQRHDQVEQVSGGIQLLADYAKLENSIWFLVVSTLFLEVFGILRNKYRFSVNS